jgi:probable phosphoglycerate mutase
MTKIYLIRHAEAEGNLYRRIHGQYDSLITPNGMRQIEALQKRFENVPIDCVASSDLYRARTTAASIYAPKKLPLLREPRFREVRLGAWEDVPFGWLEQFDAERLHAFNHNPADWHVEGAETFSEYTGRFLEALKELAAKNEGGTVAVFTHGCVLRGVQYLLSDNNWPPYCDNTAVSLLDYEDGKFTFEYLNDNSHLSDEISTFARQKWWRENADRGDYNMWFRPIGNDDKDFLHLRREAMEGKRDDLDQIYEDSILNAFWDARANAFAMLRDKPAGVVELSPARYLSENVGYISYLGMENSERGKALGVQLIGYAVSYYRQKKRSRLRLSVPPENESALRFFQKYGFRETSEPVNGNFVLEMNISVKK